MTKSASYNLIIMRLWFRDFPLCILVDWVPCYETLLLITLKGLDPSFSELTFTVCLFSQLVPKKMPDLKFYNVNFISLHFHALYVRKILTKKISIFESF